MARIITLIVTVPLDDDDSTPEQVRSAVSDDLGGPLGPEVTLAGNQDSGSVTLIVAVGLDDDDTPEQVRDDISSQLGGTFGPQVTLPANAVQEV